LDTNGDGKIDYAEFTTAAIDRRIILNQKNLEASFKIFDQDGNGQISIDELR
jgi:calcium-dependent protein kinase